MIKNSYPINGPLGAVAWNLDSTIVVSPFVSLTSRLKICWMFSLIASVKMTSASQIAIVEQSTWVITTIELISPLLPMPESKKDIPLSDRIQICPYLVYICEYICFPSIFWCDLTNYTGNV